MRGKGNPNSESFKKSIEKLYKASYQIRMSHKKGLAPSGYFEYTVYPLEGFWSLTNEGVKHYKMNGSINKDYLTFELMIRQPDFVSDDYATQILKSNDLYDGMTFEVIDEGLNLQMLHVGPFEKESESFEEMLKYCENDSLRRIGFDHKEIYLSDTRKVSSDKYRTILRFPIEKI